MLKNEYDINGCRQQHSVYVGNYGGYCGVIYYEDKYYFPLHADDRYVEYHDCNVGVQAPVYKLKKNVDAMTEKMKHGDIIYLNEDDWIKC